MVGLREQKKNETRLALTEAALKLFSERGFEKTSIEDIAREAGIGKATVYGYFATKDEIFIAYCDDELEESFARLQEPQRQDRKLLDQLVDFFMLKFRFLTKNNEFGRQLLREMMFPKVVGDKTLEHDQRYFDILKKFFRSAQGRGEIALEQDLFYLSVHFFSLYLGILAGWYTGHVSTYKEVEEAMRILFQQAMTGILACANE